MDPVERKLLELGWKLPAAPVPAATGAPFRNTGASCGPRPSRCTRSRRTAPSPVPTSSRSSSTWPGGPSTSSKAESRAFTRTGPLSVGSRNQAPGKGDSPRIFQSICRPGLSQAIRATLGPIFLA